MIPFYGRHGAKQFIAGKPIRFGFKMWALCTPSGYLINFEPYQGARGSRMETDKRLGVGGSVVMRLVDDLPKQPFVIYADRFFSSVRLAEELLKVCEIPNTPIMAIFRKASTSPEQFAQIEWRSVLLKI